jgi:hypothetical protein
MPVMFVVIVLAGWLGGIQTGDARSWFPWYPWCARYVGGIDHCAYVSHDPVCGPSAASAAFAHNPDAAAARATAAPPATDQMKPGFGRDRGEENMRIPCVVMGTAFAVIAALPGRGGAVQAFRERHNCRTMSRRACSKISPRRRNRVRATPSIPTTLETKLLAGKSGYDVVPTAFFRASDQDRGVQKLDKAKLPNLPMSGQRSQSARCP